MFPPDTLLSTGSHWLRVTPQPWYLGDGLGSLLVPPDSLGAAQALMLACLQLTCFEI